MTPDQYKAAIARRLRMAIRTVMEEHEVTQAEIARQAGISPQRLGNYLRGDNYPDPYALWLFCQRWGMTADWIYRGELHSLPSKYANSLRDGAIGTLSEGVGSAHPSGRNR
jgi:transcriptional regulator with XRE-family HTH domain